MTRSRRVPCPACQGTGERRFSPHDPKTGVTFDVLLIEACPECDGLGCVRPTEPPPLPTLPTLDGRLGVAFTPSGLHLSLWQTGQPSRETTLEPHHALDLMRWIEREYGRQDEQA